MRMARSLKPKAWVVAVDMGYGHQRAAFALRHLAANHGIITANEYPGIPSSDKAIWQESRGLYEAISRFKKVPVIGDFVFSILDRFQEIEPFYPKTQGVEPPGLSLRAMDGLIESKEWGKHLIGKLNKNPLPLLCTFSTIAFMAQHWGYKGPIFLVETDADIARSWVPLHPTENHIIYCAPTTRVVERLKSYGVLSSRISLTGFPLPQDLLGENCALAKRNLKKRLARLDPERKYLSSYGDLVKRYLGSIPPMQKTPGPVTITFSVGGAGAQMELGGEILKNCAELLSSNQLRLCLVAGIRKEVAAYFTNVAREVGLGSFLGKQVSILYSKTKAQYFEDFEKVLQDTDVLWTKPSELCFFAGLGIPILIAPPMGSQEVQNRKWLLHVGAGIDQLPLASCHEWIADFLKEGVFAEAAMQGFVEIEKNGVKNIAKLLRQASDNTKQ